MDRNSKFRKRITPWITELKPKEVFVFGSNLAGNHGKGAAHLAKKFGAKNKIGEGLMGQSYGIPTKPYDVRKVLSIKQIENHVNTFIKFAKERTDLVFLVTEIGCGLAGFEPKDIAPLFRECINLDHVYIPSKFWKELGVEIN